MNSFLARFFYYTSIGWDTSEYPEAGIRQRYREALLRQRVGDMEFNRIKNMLGSSDPAFYASAAPMVLPIIGLIGAIVVMIVMAAMNGGHL